MGLYATEIILNPMRHLQEDLMEWIVQFNSYNPCCESVWNETYVIFIKESVIGSN